MPKIVISECTSTTEAFEKLSPKVNKMTSSRHWWSPAVKKLREKKYICELYVNMRQSLNKVNRRSKSLLPPAKVFVEDDDPGGVVTESYVTKFSLIKAIFDVNNERYRSFSEDNEKASFNEVTAWINHFDVQAHSTALEREDMLNFADRKY